MHLDRIGQWVGVFANIGVLIGFILVAIQLHLNTQALETASAHKSSDLFSNAEMALMGDTGYAAFARALTHPEATTPVEAAQIWSYFSLGLHAASQAYSDYRRGAIPEARWIYSADIYISMINHPVGLLFWESSKGVYPDPVINEFIDALQARLEQTPANLTQKQFRAVMDAIRNITPED